MKAVLAIALITTSAAANAVTVVLLTHNQTSTGGVISTLITDGSHIQGQPASTAIFEWDGTTLTSTGLYSAVGALNSSPFAPTILNDQVIDLSIDTGTGTASATAYTCEEGTFLAGVGANGCGDYTLGVNFVDESTTVWTGVTVSQTIGGDDVAGTDGPRLISAFDFGFVTITGVDGLTNGDLVAIGNGLALGDPNGGELMTFQVTSSAVVANDDTAGGRANETINIPVLANDDNIVDNVTALSITAPTNGTAILNGGPLPAAQAGLSIDYTSAIGFSGVATFDYTVTDANSSSDTATVTVTVTNQVPVAVDDTSATGLVTPVVVDVLANDTLGDGPSAAVAVTAQPPNGNVVVTNSPNAVPANIVVTYTPNGGHTGPDTFTYELTDDNGDTDTANVTVTTSAGLAAVDDSAATQIAAPVVIDVLANDANLTNPDFSVDVTSAPTKGTVTTVLPVICTLPANCSLSYTPNAGAVGNDTFVYQVTDNLAATSSATVTVFINDIPVANPDTLPAITAMPTSLNVQTNDTGLNDTPITVAITANPANGTAIPDAGTPQMVTYTSIAGFIGQDTFTYELQDSNGDTSNTATVTVNVDDAPVANDNGTMGTPAFFVSPGATVSLDVLANDTGLTDTPLTVSLVNPVSTLGAPAVTGSPGDASAILVDYVAGPALGTDSFGYQIADNSGDTASATVFIAVTDQGIPVAVDDAGTWPAQVVPENSDSISVDVLANDQRLDDAPLTVTITSNPDNGFINVVQGCDTQGGLCRVWYTPDAGFVGADAFQYMVTDSTPDSSNIATVTMTVKAIPAAFDDTASTMEGNTVTIDVLANDTGLNNPDFIVDVTVPPAKGVITTTLPVTCTLPADCLLSYVPDAGQIGSDTISYTITDASDRSSKAQVNVTIVADQGALPGKSSAVGPVGLGLLLLLPWLKRRRR